MQLPSSAPYEEMEMSRNTVPSLARNSCYVCCSIACKTFLRCVGVKGRQRDRNFMGRSQSSNYAYHSPNTGSSTCSTGSRSSEANATTSEVESSRLLPKSQELSAPLSSSSSLRRAGTGSLEPYNAGEACNSGPAPLPSQTSVHRRINSNERTRSGLSKVASASGIKQISSVDGLDLGSSSPVYPGSTTAKDTNNSATAQLPQSTRVASGRSTSAGGASVSSSGSSGGGGASSMNLAVRQKTVLTASKSLVAAVAAAAGISLDDDDLCPTCLDPYSPDNPKCFTSCGHHFHLPCLFEWRERKDTCPMCEAPVHIPGID